MVRVETKENCEIYSQMPLRNKILRTITQDDYIFKSSRQMPLRNTILRTTTQDGYIFKRYRQMPLRNIKNEIQSNATKKRNISNNCFIYKIMGQRWKIAYKCTAIHWADPKSWRHPKAIESKCRNTLHLTNAHQYRSVVPGIVWAKIKVSFAG